MLKCETSKNARNRFQRRISCHSKKKIRGINIYSFAMLPTTAMLIYCICLHNIGAVLDSNSVRRDFTNTRTDTKTRNDMRKGDQSIGGVHLFEFHSPGGGMGIGLKTMLFAIIAAAVLYWCLKEKCRAILGRYTNPPVQRALMDVEDTLEMAGPRVVRAKDVFSSSSS